MSILNFKFFKLINVEHSDISNNDIFTEINKNIYNSVLHIIDMENNILLTYDF